MEHEGLALGHKMAEIAGSNAGEDWVEMAVEAIEDYAHSHEKFTTEQVRAAYPDMPQPPDKRAWGAAVKAARKAGHIEPHGWVRADSRTVHGMVVTMWASKIYRGEAA